MGRHRCKVCECGFAEGPNHLTSDRHIRGLRIVSAIRSGRSFTDIGHDEKVSREAIRQLAERIGYDATVRIANERQIRIQDGIAVQLSVLDRQWPRLFISLQEHDLSFELISSTQENARLRDLLYNSQLIINGHRCLLRKARISVRESNHYVQIHQVRWKEPFDYVLFLIPEGAQWIIFPRPILPKAGTMFNPSGAMSDLGYTTGTVHDYYRLIEAWHLLADPTTPILPAERPTQQGPSRVFLQDSKRQAGPTQEEIDAFLRERRWKEEQADRLDTFERS
jgi:hypothetical protein